MNIKAVDKASEYVKMQLIPNKMAVTTRNFIEKFKVRSERQTGMKLKVIAADSGTEFNGEFLSYLEHEGIIKRKGQGYDHHFPPLAENSHRIISSMARTMLLDINCLLNTMVRLCSQPAMF